MTRLQRERAFDVLVSVVGAVIVLAAVIVCTACASTQPPVVVPAKIAVATTCTIADIPEPDWATDSLPTGAQPGEQFRALRAERLQRIGYVKNVKDTLSAARKPVAAAP